jgi:hypothetical protein
MATDPNRFISLGMPAILASEVAQAIDAASGAEITVTLTGDVTGTGSGTTEIEIATTVTP